MRPDQIEMRLSSVGVSLLVISLAVGGSASLHCYSAADALWSLHP